jgi:hypothetical protein
MFSALPEPLGHSDFRAVSTVDATSLHTGVSFAPKPPASPRTRARAVRSPPVTSRLVRPVSVLSMLSVADLGSPAGAGAQ